ncbi:efflux RND transporter permease subunit [Natronoflexus pectinivorans]|uniref:Cobalt-zinc-cadmium resistance protein CzcA n=1 Tax=Natronoflexus pectinivorans TaxID=682526 RepID=A0A4R2GFU2_9BACT|nr:CusA/CzcA family heavy metal efflux RND transporter [Natronoflexus pectinivorans]TCO07062.1 cobalt-zinc-cadmium resistance protein CzcA [Natronoflexus pectinivorans]
MLLENFIRFCLSRRGIMAALFVFLAIFGYYSFTRLEIDAYPDIADVTSMVVTQYPGHAAETIEEQVTIPIERALNGMPGLVVMRSKSTFGLSMITLVFADGIDDYFARQLIRERLIEAELPEGAEPELEPLTSPTGEIFRYTIHSDIYSQRELRELQDWVIIPKLREVFGVAEVVTHGGETTQFQCEIDPEKLLKYSLSLEDVIEAVEDNNSNAGGGRVNRGDLAYVIRGIGLVRSLEDLGNVVVTSIDGTPIFLRDLGELKLGAMERNGMLGRDDEDDLVQGIVVLLRHMDPSPVLANVNKMVDELNNKILPEGVRIDPYYDRTELIQQTTRSVSFTLLQGIGLVVLILLLFMGSIRSALIVACVIPFAMLISFALMYLTDIPANLLSLGALSFGILVDAAIVIVEALQARREKNPDETFTEERVAESTIRVGKPIFFAVLIIIAAHLPLFAFERIEAKFFIPMAYTVAYALGGALLFSLAVIPALMLWSYRNPSKVFVNKPLEWLKARYNKMMTFLLNYPRYAIIPAIIAILLTAFTFNRIGKEFLPYIDEGSIWLQVKMPAGISMEKGAEMAAELRRVAREFPEVKHIVTQLGRNDDGTDPFTPSHIESMVVLHPYNTWNPRRSKLKLIEEMDKRFQQIPGMFVGFSQPMIDGVNDKVAGAHSELVVKVFGDDFVETRRIAEEIIDVLETVEGAVDLAIDQEPPLPQMQIMVDRDAASRFGINVSQISELIEVGIGGQPVSEIFLGQRRYDVILRYPEHMRNTPEKIGNLLLTSPDGASIALSQVANIIMTTGESTISREMNRRHATVKLNLRGRDFSHFFREAQAAIEERVKYDQDLYTTEWGGLFENKERAEGRALVILAMVLGITFLLLYAEFGTVRHPSIILASLPLAILGGLVALQTRGMTVNVASTVGFIALSGLAVQNGVILISNINRIVKKRSNELKESVIEGATQRLRPVLITATTTLFGVLPAAYAFGVGSDIQRPLTTVVMGGLISATILTMIILPVIYYLVEKRFTR